MNLSETIQAVANAGKAPILPAQPDREYIVVTDNTSEVLLSTNDRHEAQKFAGKVRRAGGSVTLFKALQL